MATINARNYQFNEALSFNIDGLTDTDITADIHFKAIVNFSDLGPCEVLGTKMYFFTDGSDIIGRYTITALDQSDTGFISQVQELCGIDLTGSYDIEVYRNGWNVEPYSFLGSTNNIEVLGDNDVSGQFLLWFAYNVTPAEEEPEEPTAVIKAGTYRFNDVLDVTYSATADINFNFAGYNAEYGINITAHCNHISNGYTGEVGGYSVEPTYHLVSTDPDIGMESADYFVYGSDEGWRNEMYGLDLQTITVTEDTEVSDEFNTWFTANTTAVSDEPEPEPEPDPDPEPEPEPDPAMAVIKAGTYRFNEIIETSTICEHGVIHEEHITFTTNLVTDVLGTAEATFNKMTLMLTGDFDNLCHEISVVMSGCPVFEGALRDYGLDPNNYFPIEIRLCSRWEDGEVEWWTNQLEDFGITYEPIQTITITSDAEVSDEFNTWFTANADIVNDEGGDEPTEPDEPDTPDIPSEPDTPDAAASITYNGSTIASLLGGQTATLKCAGMTMESDVVVDVAEQSGGGECNHEVYDLSTDIFHTITPKAKIDRPTAEQIALFEDGNIILNLPDTEQIADIISIDYVTIPIAEGVTITPLYLRVDKIGFRAYYVWEEDVSTAKLTFESMGIDVSGITGEGWQFEDGASFKTLTEDELLDYDFRGIYPLFVPCDDYLDSLFNFYTADGREPTEIVRADNHALLTQNTVCETDILVKRTGYKLISITGADGGGIGDIKDYDDLLYIDIDIIGNVSRYSDFTFEGKGFDYHGVTCTSYWINPNSEKTSTVVHRRNNFGINLSCGGDYTFKVYTNANIVSQSEREVFISGLRHNTHIAIVVEAVS